MGNDQQQQSTEFDTNHIIIKESKHRKIKRQRGYKVTDDAITFHKLTNGEKTEEWKFADISERPIYCKDAKDIFKRAIKIKLGKDKDERIIYASKEVAMSLYVEFSKEYEKHLRSRRSAKKSKEPDVDRKLQTEYIELYDSKKNKVTYMVEFKQSKTKLDMFENWKAGILNDPTRIDNITASKKKDRLCNFYRIFYGDLFLPMDKHDIDPEEFSIKYIGEQKALFCIFEGEVTESGDMSITSNV